MKWLITLFEKITKTVCARLNISIKFTKKLINNKYFF